MLSLFVYEAYELFAGFLYLEYPREIRCGGGRVLFLHAAHLHTEVLSLDYHEPLDSYYVIKIDGIFQSDAEAAAYVDKNGKRIQPNAVAGDLKFVDANGDGVINDKDRQYCGNAMPETTFALSMGCSYKKLSVSAMLQGVGGAQSLYMAKYMLLGDVEGNFNRQNTILDAWSPNNTSSKIPRLSKADPNGNFTTPSDWYLEDASYLRIKNVTVAYDLTDMLRKSCFADRSNSRLPSISAVRTYTLSPDIRVWTRKPEDTTR